MMITTKRSCPECGHKVEGRSNKIYCSDACKKKAHLEGKTQKPELFLETKIIPEKEAVFQDPKALLDLKLQMQRENQTHQKEMRELEIKKEMELRKMDLEEQEKKRAHELELYRIEQEALYENSDEPEKDDNGQEYQETEIEEEYENEEEQEDEEEGIPLPDKAIKLFKKALRSVLKDDEVRLKKEEVQTKLSAVGSLRISLEEWAEKQETEVDIEEYEEYQVAFRLEELYEEMLSKYHLLRNTYFYTLTEETVEYYNSLLKNR